jgi:hypothetical protein
MPNILDKVRSNTKLAGRGHPLNRIWLSYLLIIFIIISTTTESFSQLGFESDYLQGQCDARKDVKQQPQWACFGCFVGPLAAIVPLVIENNPPPERLIGKSQEYAIGYNEAYKQARKNKDSLSALLGGVISTAILTTLFLSAVLSN